MAAISALKDQLDGLGVEVGAFGAQAAAAGRVAAEAINLARSQVLALKQDLGGGLLGGSTVQQTASQATQLGASWSASTASLTESDKRMWDAFVENASSSGAQIRQIQAGLSVAGGQRLDADAQNFVARESDKVRAATQAGADLMDLDQQASERAVAASNAGAEQQVAAAARVSQARTAAAAQQTSASQRAYEDDARLAVEAANMEIKALQAGLKEKQTVFSAEAQQHQISQDQKFAALETETQKEYEAELALLQKELTIGDLRVSQTQSIEARIAALKQKNSLEMIKIDEQSIAAAQRSWDGYFTAVEGAFDSQLKGLISGTTTWGAAFRNILTDLLVKFIEMTEKMALQWAAGEMARTTATTSGAAARAAAETSAGAASLAGTVANALRSIMASAAETFAGIFGFLSPVMGPAAAGPAAAGQATVAAAAGGLSAFALGSWQLPADMVAQVHKGEMIVPAAHTPWAQSLMSRAGKQADGAAASAGDVHVHHATNFNIQALDSRDVKRWIAGNGRTILDTINKSVRNGAHIGLSKLS